jgi:Uncharacterised protein family (UPF0158)
MTSGGGLVEVDRKDFDLAYAWLEAGEREGGAAFIDRETGKIYCVLDFAGEPQMDEPPEGWEDDEERYLHLPTQRELDLGRALVFAFVEDHLPDDYDRVRDYFRKRGAYGRFKELLLRRNCLERWYAYQAEAQEIALAEWCRQNGVKRVERKESKPPAEGSEGSASSL